MSDQRKYRGQSQRLYLIETIDTKTMYAKKYSVMGSTGNVYEVTIKDEPECTCPDYATRGNRCKHIYFILIRVMKCDDEDKDLYTNKDLLGMFTNIPKLNTSIVIDGKKKQLYDQLKNKTPGQTAELPRGDVNDLCPVCLDDLENGDELDHCKFSCGKPIHKVCYTMWTKKHTMDCIYCKAKWIPVSNDSGYVNLTS